MRKGWLQDEPVLEIKADVQMMTELTGEQTARDQLERGAGATRNIEGVGTQTYVSRPDEESSRAHFVSVVIPCFNGERFIAGTLDKLVNQFESDRYEIIVVDGMSVDKTRAIVSEFIASHTQTEVKLIDNPARSIPVGLNIGIKEARGDVIARMDVHSNPSENYVRHCVGLLNNPEVAVVGAPIRVSPGTGTLTAQAIALAVCHPFGIGDAKYRLADSTTQFVDTVPFGVFRKSLWQTVGGFDENLLSNEDYDFYYRVRQQGGRILLNADAYCTYFARPTIKELAAQYARYGGWKAQMVKLHPRSLRLRQMVAPAFVLYVLCLTVLSFFWPPALLALLPVVAFYALLAVFFALVISRRYGNLRLAFVVPFVFLVIHVAWGGSFLLSLLRPPKR